MHLRIPTFVALLLPVVVSAQAADEIRCQYDNADLCSKSGCRQLPVGDRFLLAPPLRALEAATDYAREGTRLPQIRRCDERGCTPVEVTAEISGVYLNLSNVHAGYLLKFARMDEPLLGLQRGEFVEVATFSLSTYVWHGHCRFAS